MKDTRSFSAEAWLSDDDAFLFRCFDPRRGDMWTFRLSRAALKELHPDEPFVPAAVFDTFRAAIYSAAFIRMEIADPIVPQELLVADVHAELERLLDQSRNDPPEAKHPTWG